MSKKLFLTFFISLISAIGILKSQDIYDLYDMTDEEFKNGGNTFWSFERYDKATGLYAPFTIYGDSGRINQYDPYQPYRFGGVLKAEIKPDLPGGHQAYGYFPLMNGLYSSKDEFVYVGSKDTKFETQPQKDKSPAFVFTVPADGYYKIEMSVQNQDAPTAKFKPYPMIVNRYRYSDQENINYVNSQSDMGVNKSYSQDGVRINSGDAIPPEYGGGVADRAWNTPFQPEGNIFYFKAKSGDKITVEASYGDGADNASDFTSGHGVWVRTRWHALKATKVNSSEAESSDRYVDPYANPDLIKLDELFDQMSELSSNIIVGNNKGQWKQEYVDEFEAFFISFANVYPDGINVMNAKSWEIRITDFIADFMSKQNKVTWADHYKLFPYDDANEQEAIFSKTNAKSPWDFKSYTNATGVYNSMSTYSLGGKYTATKSWYDNANDWFYLALDGQMHPLTAKQPAILFKAPVSGYYQIGATMVRNAGSPDNRNYEMFHRYRYIAAGSEQIAPKESYLVAKGYGSGANVALRNAPSPVDFYVKLNAGDILTFEQDCYTPNQNGNAGSHWERLTVIDLQKEYDSEAEILAAIDADTLELVNPNAVGDFTTLQNKIDEIEAFYASISVGSGLGEYSEFDKMLLDGVLAEAKEMIEDNIAPQYKIEVMLADLSTAYNIFAAAKITVIATPNGTDINGKVEGELPTGAYYIKSPEGYYLTVPAEGTGSNGIFFDEKNARLKPFYSKKIKTEGVEEPVKNSQAWHVSYNETYDTEEYKRYTLVGAFNDANGGSWADDGVGHLGENGEFMEGNTAIAQSTTGNNHTWRNFSIYFDGKGYCLYNVEKKWSLVIAPEIVDGEPTTSTIKTTLAGVKEFYYQIVPIADDVEDYNPGASIDDPESNHSSLALVGGSNYFAIINAQAGDVANVYDLSGRLVKTAKISGSFDSIVIDSGIYIVKVSGRKVSKVGKVIVTR